MSLEKYDRFQRCNDFVAEHTGIKAGWGGNFIFKIIKSDSDDFPVGNAWYSTEDEVSEPLYKKLPRPATHPLLDEVARMSKDDAGFLDEFLDGFARLWEIMTPEQKRDLIFSLNERLPQEIKDSFHASEGCCGEHEERFSAHKAMLARQRNGLPLDEKEIRPKKEHAL